MALCLVMGLLIGVGYGQTFKRKPRGKPVTKSGAALPEGESNIHPDRITTHELKRKLEAKEKLLILDNRTGSAWIGSQVKIKGALHMPMQELMQQFDKLPKDKEIITYCA
jgi:3-mercaptopyruvate sulfurtransferase SseA